MTRRAVRDQEPTRGVGVVQYEASTLRGRAAGAMEDPAVDYSKFVLNAVSLDLHRHRFERKQIHAL
jgi:hypothetical protein